MSGNASEREVLFLAGDGLVETRLSGPLRVIDPPPGPPPLADFGLAVGRALDAPLGMAPLTRLVGRGARVVVAFDDPCLPLPTPLRDPREVMLEQVLDVLSGAGVRDTDVQLICANGLHRKWTRRELLPLVGRRTMRRHGARLRCYDGEDAEANRELGTTESGLLVEVDRAVAEADLVIYLAVPWTEMNGGHKSIACGLSSYRSIRQHHGPEVQAQSPLMHPERSDMHARLREMGRLVGRHVPVLQVEAVLDRRLWAGPLRGLDLQRRRIPGYMRPAHLLPCAARRTLARGFRSFYRPASVWAGEVETVHERTLEFQAAYRAGPAEQADILLLGVPDQSPYAAYSRTNPLLAANLGLGYMFQFARPVPLVRRGGRVILVAPFRPGFHPRHHLAYQRFWDEVLPVTRDAARMAAEFEPVFVADEGLRDAYQHRLAYHPAHPFFAYYWMARALAHVGGVIVAGAVDEAVVERLGFRAAPTVEAALAEARAELGPGTEAVVHTLPPVFTVDVAAPPLT